MPSADRRLRAAPPPAPGPETTPEDPRLVWLRTATAPAVQVLRRELDRDDWTCLAGLLLLVAGLWIWVGLGPALTTVGGMVLALGVASARQAPAAAAKPTQGGGG